MRLVAELLLAKDPIPDPNPSAYASASPQRLKGFFQQFQEAVRPDARRIFSSDVNRSLLRIAAFFWLH